MHIETDIVLKPYNPKTVAGGTAADQHKHLRPLPQSQTSPPACRQSFLLKEMQCSHYNVRHFAQNELH